MTIVSWLLQSRHNFRIAEQGGGGRGGSGGGGRGGTGGEQGGGGTPLVKQGQKVAISCDLCGWNYTPHINLYQLHLEYVSTKQRLIFIFYYKMWALNIFILLRKCDKREFSFFAKINFLAKMFSSQV